MGRSSSGCWLWQSSASLPTNASRPRSTCPSENGIHSLPWPAHAWAPRGSRLRPAMSEGSRLSVVAHPARVARARDRRQSFGGERGSRARAVERRKPVDGGGWPPAIRRRSALAGDGSICFKRESATFRCPQPYEMPCSLARRWRLALASAGSPSLLWIDRLPAAHWRSIRRPLTADFHPRAQTPPSKDKSRPYGATLFCGIRWRPLPR